MNLSEVARIAEIVAGSVAGLGIIYFGGTVILNRMRSRHNGDIVDIPTTPTRSLGSGQPNDRQICSPVSPCDQRHDTLQPPSNRGMKPSKKRSRGYRREA